MSGSIPTGFQDRSLEIFAARGAPALPPPRTNGHVTRSGARIWYATFGTGVPVILLHGGLGHSGNWGYQLGALLEAGYRPILIDSRGHGRSTLGEQELHYELMAGDVLAVMDQLAIERAAIAGWSDGACIAMTLAMHNAQRLSGVFYFACNMDASGIKPFLMTEEIQRCLSRHQADYRSLSPTPDDFDVLQSKLQPMQANEPSASATDLAAISVPVAIVHAEHDEFITLEHARYLALTIPGATFIWLGDASHFAPLQYPDRFNTELIKFLDAVSDRGP